MPLLATDVANIEIHEVYHIILDIDDIWLLTPLIAITARIGTGDILTNVRKPGILASELVQENLVPLRRLLLNHHFHDEAALGILFLESALATHTTKLLALGIHLHVEIVLANRTIAETTLRRLFSIMVRG
jgi:hypothetical protein